MRLVDNSNLSSENANHKMILTEQIKFMKDETKALKMRIYDDTVS